MGAWGGDYTKEFKLKAVKEYLQTHKLRQTAKKYGVSEVSIRNWVKAYEKTGTVPMKRQKSTRTAEIGCYVEPELYDFLQDLADKYGSNKSAIIRKLILVLYNKEKKAIK